MFIRYNCTKDRYKYTYSISGYHLKLIFRELKKKKNEEEEREHIIQYDVFLVT